MLHDEQLEGFVVAGVPQLLDLLRIDLSDHLHDQLTLLRLSPRELLLGEEIIGNISDEGYLTRVSELRARRDAVANHPAPASRPTGPLLGCA